MRTNALIALIFIASAFTISCDSAQFAGENSVIGYDGADEKATQKESNASAKAFKTLNTSDDEVSNDYQFKFQLAENESQDSFELNETISNQKKLTLHASYLDVERGVNVSPGETGYTVVNYDGTINGLRRRFFDKNFIDIILVVDNSSSMKTPQELLAAALPSIKTSLQGMNWRIILTSTDNNDTCALKIMDTNTPDAELSNSVLLGSNGSDQEVPLQKAYNILAGKCSVATIRPEAAPAIMILTNEDECSTGTVGNCPVVAGKTVGFPGGYSFSDAVAKVPKMATYDIPIGVIAWLPADAACSLGITKASAIATQFGRFGATILGSICAADYSKTLTTFATNIKNMPSPFETNVYALLNWSRTYSPLKDSQTVQFADGTVLKAPEVKLENLVISIPYQASYFDKVATVSATQQGVPRTNVIKWATDTKGGCDQTISYSGVVVIRNLFTGKYEYSNTTPDFPKFKMSTTSCELTFESAFTFPYQVTVNTVPKAATQPKIVLGENTVASSIVAKLDKVVLPADAYTISGVNNLLTLKNAITKGSLVVSYKALNDPIIRYDLAIPANATELTVVDSAGVPITIQRDGTAIVLDRSDISEGREIEVRYKTITKSTAKVTLSNKPADLDALYNMIMNQCAVSLTIAKAIYNEAERSIDLAKCLNSSSNSKLELQYKSLLANTEFTLPITNENIKSIDQISVTLNGKEFVNYSLAGNVISLPSLKEIGEMVVKLKVTSIAKPQ